MGTSKQVCNTEKEELLILHAPEVGSEELDFELKSTGTESHPVAAEYVTKPCRPLFPFPGTVISELGVVIRNIKVGLSRTRSRLWYAGDIFVETICCNTKVNYLCNNASQ